MTLHKGIKLRLVISLLVLITAICIISINWYTSNHMFKETLRAKHLQTNYEYALKISSSTSDMLSNLQLNISNLAEILGKQSLTQEELDRWLLSNNTFNSIFTTDANGVVQLMSPEVVEWNSKVKAGTQIKSELMKQALKNKKPFISDPYKATSGQLMILISSPVFDQTGNYKGVVDGTIYLESRSTLDILINEHQFKDGSSIFVVDRNGRIIYHPDSTRINESIADHPLVQKVIQGKSGAEQIINNKGVEYFSGYAYVEGTGWGVITQTPTTVIDKPLSNLFKEMILKSVPLLLIILVAAELLSGYLSKPLTTLARFSEDAIKQENSYSMNNHINITSKIYEYRQLYYHISEHFKLLTYQNKIDGLTGLANRRTFDLVLAEWLKQKTPFSLIMLDIDFFKKVNDTYGHLVGDDVLRHLSGIINSFCREEDFCFRYGGEEFVILLRNKSLKDAFIVAERLREKVAETVSPTGQPITISLGITSSDENDNHPEEIIDRADIALYRSKTGGRNLTSVFEGK